MNHSACRRAAAHQVYTRFAKSLPRPEILDRRDLDVLGHLGVLTVQRLAPGRLRATVCVYLHPPRGERRGDFASVWSLPGKVHDEAHRLAREALVARNGRPTAEHRWSIGFIADGEELAPENDG